MSMTMEDIDRQIVENPLSYEESKEQFVKLTEELGLKHSFNFDEAWETTLELKRRKEYRKQIQEFQDKCLGSGAMEKNEKTDAMNPLKHSFADGMYIREIINPAGQILITKIHKQKHPFFLLSGKMSILTEDGVQHIEGPHYGITDPGTKRVIYSHTLCKFVTVQKTDITDVEEIENTLVCDSFNDASILAEDIELLLNWGNK